MDLVAIGLLDSSCECRRHRGSSAPPHSRTRPMPSGFLIRKTPPCSRIWPTPDTPTITADCLGEFDFDDDDDSDLHDLKRLLLRFGDRDKPDAGY